MEKRFDPFRASNILALKQAQQLLDGCNGDAVCVLNNDSFQSAAGHFSKLHGRRNAIVSDQPRLLALLPVGDLGNRIEAAERHRVACAKHDIERAFAGNRIVEMSNCDATGRLPTKPTALVDDDFTVWTGPLQRIPKLPLTRGLCVARDDQCSPHRQPVSSRNGSSGETTASRAVDADKPRTRRVVVVSLERRVIQKHQGLAKLVCEASELSAATVRFDRNSETAHIIVGAIKDLTKMTVLFLGAVVNKRSEDSRPKPMASKLHKDIVFERDLPFFCRSRSYEKDTFRISRRRQLGREDIYL